MSPTPGLAIGAVVQIDPAMGGHFPGCFAVVTEVRPWGVIADVHLPGVQGMADGGALARTVQIAPIRLAWEHIEFCGVAKWTVRASVADAT